MKNRDEKMVEMFNLQKRLNDDTNGSKWREGVTKQGKVINWKRCIIMESTELMDSFSWKHWKNIDGGIDYENIKIELVDIWHFVMSYLLRFHSPEDAAKIALETMSGSDVKIPRVWESKTHNPMIDALLDPFENLMAIALVKSDDEVYQEDLTAQFWVCADTVDMKFDDLYRLYIGKNALNQFRQMHGYKEGTYKKIWDGKEDNVVMQNILKNNPDISYEKLLDYLEDAYAALE